MRAARLALVAEDQAVAPGRGRDRVEELNVDKQEFARDTKARTLGDAIEGADVFVGVSQAGVVTGDMVRSMAANPIVFAMANPDPEIRPEAADGLAAVMATGRSDFPNQINNVLAFPGIFRGAFDVGAVAVTEGMKVAAAHAIAASVSEDDLTPDFVVPSVFDKSVAPAVAKAVAGAAVVDGAVRS